MAAIRFRLAGTAVYAESNSHYMCNKPINNVYNRILLPYVLIKQSNIFEHTIRPRVMERVSECTFVVYVRRIPTDLFNRFECKLLLGAFE